MLIKESLEDVLLGKDTDKMKEELKNKSLNDKWELIDEFWPNTENFILDIRRYMGGFKFDDMIDDMIVMKERGEL